MPALAPILPVAAPDFALSAPNGVLDYRWPFAGYGFILGVQLARFGVSPPGGTPEDWRADYRQWFTQTREMVRRHLRPEEEAAAAGSTSDRRSWSSTRDRAIPGSNGG